MQQIAALGVHPDRTRVYEPGWQSRSPTLKRYGGVRASSDRLADLDEWGRCVLGHCAPVSGD